MAEYAERRLVTRGGLELFARDYPGQSGPAKLPVICLHGLTRNSVDFAGVAAAIAQTGRRVIVPDMRGRGRSAFDPQPMNYTPATYADDALAWLDALGIAHAIFMGTSMGGVISVAVAAKRQGAIAAAILNDIGPVASPEGLARIAGYAGKTPTVQTWSEAADYVRSLNAAAHPELDAAAWLDFARRTFREGPDARPILDYDPNIAIPIKAGRLTVPSALAWTLFTRFAKKRPVLLLRGGISDILSRETVLKWKAKAPALQYVEIDGVGHAPLLTERQAGVAIADFLAKQP